MLAFSRLVRREREGECEVGREEKTGRWRRNLGEGGKGHAGIKRTFITRHLGADGIADFPA
jgi:hypothetical protein